jgi:hypothetical protein
MDRKMRGIADPYTLGIVIAFVSTLLAYTFNDHDQVLVTKPVESSSVDKTDMQF